MNASPFILTPEPTIWPAVSSSVDLHVENHQLRLGDDNPNVRFGAKCHA
jgi:hypothetical protein